MVETPKNLDSKDLSKIDSVNKTDQLAENLLLSEKEQKQLAAVEQNREAIKYIENPSEEVQLAAVTQHWRAIRYIENPSEEVQLAAVKQDREAINYIKNPSEEVIKYVKSQLN